MPPNQNDIYERLGSIEQKLDSNDNKLDRAIQIITKKADDHEKRMRGLERFRWILLVVAAASGRAWDIFTGAI